MTVAAVTLSVDCGLALARVRERSALVQRRVQHWKGAVCGIMSFSFVLSKKACRREPSAIRELAKILQKDKTILSLGAGTPNSSAVPLSAIKFEVRVGGSCFEDHEP